MTTDKRPPLRAPAFGAGALRPSGPMLDAIVSNLRRPIDIKPPRKLEPIK